MEPTLYSQNKAIVNWLFIGCFLVFAMVIIGGITRLTGSGLSITEWKPIMGAIPPMNEKDWNIAFEKYKQIPQFKLLNSGYTLTDFKQIFFWEWLHRLLGRLIGIVFIIPFIYFVLAKKISSELLPRLIFIFFLGGFQGFLGWFMVSSGLSQLTSVSHYRLALHLITAFATAAYIFWVALGLIHKRNKNVKAELLGYYRLIKWGLYLLVFQIIYGAFVAGLDAGLIYNTWPMMNNEFIAANSFSQRPFIFNFLDHKDGIQFMHRYLAYGVAGFVFYIFYKGKMLSITYGQRNAVFILLAAVLVQFILGVFTLINAVPLSLAILHQSGAFVLLLSFIYLMHRLKNVSN